MIPFHSPLNDLVDTLNELSLRYALTDVPDDDPDRVRRNEEELRPLGDRRRNGSLPQPIPGGPAFPAKNQPVTMTQSRPVTIFRANYLYAAIASGLVIVSSVISGLLLYNWPAVGREFTPSRLGAVIFCRASIFEPQ